MASTISSGRSKHATGNFDESRQSQGKGDMGIDCIVPASHARRPRRMPTSGGLSGVRITTSLLQIDRGSSENCGPRRCRLLLRLPVVAAGAAVSPSSTTLKSGCGGTLLNCQPLLFRDRSVLQRPQCRHSDAATRETLRPRRARARPTMAQPAAAVKIPDQQQQHQHDYQNPAADFASAIATTREKFAAVFCCARSSTDGIPSGTARGGAGVMRPSLTAFTNPA